jgi:hypothetical protein
LRPLEELDDSYRARFELFIGAHSLDSGDGISSALMSRKHVGEDGENWGAPHVVNLADVSAAYSVPLAAAAALAASSACALRCLRGRARRIVAPLALHHPRFGRESAARGRSATHLWRATPSPCVTAAAARSPSPDRPISSTSRPDAPWLLRQSCFRAGRMRCTGLFCPTPAAPRRTTPLQVLLVWGFGSPSNHRQRAGAQYSARLAGLIGQGGSAEDSRTHPSWHGSGQGPRQAYRQASSAG